LRGAATLELPTDYVRPAVQGVEGAGLSFMLDQELHSAMHALCKKEG